VSQIGSAAVPVTTTFAVLRIGGNAADLGLVLAVGALTGVVLQVFGGVWADRLPRKTVILVGNLICGVLATGIGLLLLTGQARVWHFMILSIGNGVVRSVQRPATSGLVAQLVPPEQLQSASALLSLTRSVPSTAGPTIASLLVAFAGPGWSYLIDGVSFFACALLMAWIPVHGVARVKESFWRELRAGTMEVLSRGWLWQNLLSHSLWNLGFAMFFVLGPAIVISRSGSVAEWAAISTGITVGSVSGALLALRIKTSRPLVVGNLALLTGAAPFLAMFLKAPIWLVVPAAALATAGLDVLNALWSSTLQQLIPSDKMSRVSAYDWMVSLSITPVGFALAGPLGKAFGPRRALLVPILLILVPSLLASCLPSVRSIRRGARGTARDREGAEPEALEGATAKT